MQRPTRLLPLALLMLAAAVLGGACRRATVPGPGATPAAARATRYHCPMHPAYVSDRPGDCPICGMRLVPVEDGPGDGSPVSGRTSVTLTPEKRQLLGVRSQEIEALSMSHTIRTVGRVAFDERLVHHVHTKFEGYVEHLYVDFTGKLVQRGEPLLAIYSPELVATQQEYLLALKARRQLAGSGLPQVAEGGRDLLEAARQRLLFWDIEPQDIAELERSGQVQRTLDLHAESTGYVLTKNVFHGMRVMPQDTLFDIADLSHLWVLADVYESDLPSIRLGMTAELKVPYLQDKVWSGPVTNIAPTVEEKTRTVKVRVEVDNPGGSLKPDMFADVFLREDLGRGLVVPDSAVIDAGDRKLVFLDLPGGRLEPREVQLGARLPNGYRVLRGLAEGERVVIAANFLLDSESSLRAALASLSAPAAIPSSGAASAAPPSPAQPAGHRH